MKRTLKYALSAVFVAALAASALAQDSFPDTPANHWAYEAVTRLKKDGILTGYPDGLYRGGRPASRYEMAAVVHDAYVRIKKILDGQAAEIKAINDKIGNGTVTKADLDALKSALEATQSQVDSMKGWGQDIADLKKMFGEFQKELESMGVDIESVKKGLADLSSRVSALEKRKLPVDMSGVVDMFSMSGYSTNHQFGMTVDGRPTGYGRGSYQGTPVGMTRDTTVLHEGVLSLTSTNDKGPTWGGTVILGNMLDNRSGETSANNNGLPFPSQSTIATGNWNGTRSIVPFNEGSEGMYLQDFRVKWDTSISNLNFGVEAGRIGLKLSPLMFQRPDVTPYYSNDRWDNGKYYFDGANVSLKFSSAKVSLFGGRDNTAEGGSVNFNTLAPLTAGVDLLPNIIFGVRPAVVLNYNVVPHIGLTGGQLPINQHLGANVNLPLGPNGSVDLSYLWLNSNSFNQVVADGANGVHVYGGDAVYHVSGFTLDGAYAKSDMVMNNHNVVNTQNDAWWINAGKEFSRWGAKVGYRQINPQFGAPGDWGRVGTWWNPTDIKGFTADAHLDLTDKTRLSADGQFYSATGNSIEGFDDPLTTSDKVQSIAVTLSHRLSNMNSVDLGIENVTFSGPFATSPFGNPNPVSGNPFQRWYNIGFSHKMSDSASFRMLWQISDVDMKGNDFLDPFCQNCPTPHKGGLLTTQLTVKY